MNIEEIKEAVQKLVKEVFASERYFARLAILENIVGLKSNDDPIVIKARKLLNEH